jgi:hypothetical protein
MYQAGNQDAIPYHDEIEDGTVFRTFTADVDEDELVWHRDQKDRRVTVLNETDWQFQFDNEIPQVLKNTIFIPKNTYHRVIKGTGNLNIQIEEL